MFFKKKKEEKIEKRKDFRLATITGVRSPDLKLFKALTRNISISGLRIETEEDVSLNKVLQIFIDLENVSTPQEVKVVWKKR